MSITSTQIGELELRELVGPKNLLFGCSDIQLGSSTLYYGDKVPGDHDNGVQISYDGEKLLLLWFEGGECCSGSWALEFAVINSKCEQNLTRALSILDPLFKKNAGHVSYHYCAGDISKKDHDFLKPFIHPAWDDFYAYDHDFDLIPEEFREDSG